MRDGLTADMLDHMRQDKPDHPMCGRLVVVDGHCKVRRQRCSQLREPDGMEAALSDPVAACLSKFCENTPVRGDAAGRCSSCIHAANGAGGPGGLLLLLACVLLGLTCRVFHKGVLLFAALVTCVWLVGFEISDLQRCAFGCGRWQH